MSEALPNFEGLLREALTPVEPPEDLVERLEATLTTITELAADELEAWELSAMRDPRNWVRPAAASSPAAPPAPRSSCCARAGARRARRAARRALAGARPRRRRAHAQGSPAARRASCSAIAERARPPAAARPAADGGRVRGAGRRGAKLGSAQRMATCYRHPSRETGVSCSNCGRPICPDCMTTTPVGMRCPGVRRPAHRR